MISHLLQVGYVCYYLAKSNYYEYHLPAVKRNRLQVHWVRAFTGKLKYTIQQVNSQLNHFHKGTYFALPSYKKGKEKLRIQWVTQFTVFSSMYICVLVGSAWTHARTVGQWLTLQMFGNRNRQEWEVWEGIFLLHLSKLVYVQYCSSVRPHTAGYINGFSAPAHSSVSVGSPQVNKLEMYVFSKWPPYASHIQLEKVRALAASLLWTQFMCYYFASVIKVWCRCSEKWILIECSEK